MWRIGRDGAQIGGLGEMGLGNEGERKKMRKKKEERREVGEREKKKEKIKYFFNERRERV